MNQKRRYVTTEAERERRRQRMRELVASYPPRTAAATSVTRRNSFKKDNERLRERISTLERLLASKGVDLP